MMNYSPARMYFLAACVFSAAYAAAIEQYRSHHPSDRPEFLVSVSQKYYNLHRGERLKIRCRAKGGHEIDDIPMITFYRKLDDLKTIMPLSSSSYGVSITASGDKMTKRSRSRSHQERRGNIKSSFKRHRGVLRTTKILHLRKEIYHILDYGTNMFYCRATTIGGKVYEESFIINKL